MTENPQARVVLRPLATPLPLGFLAQFVATTSFSALQLGWIAQVQGPGMALCVLVLSVPLQLLASVLGFLARDPVAGTGMAVLAGTWAAAALTTFRIPPGASSSALGVVLVAAACALLVPTSAGLAKGVAAAVMAVSALRFAVTGVAELTGASGWLTAAGWVGLALALVSLYAALAFELEGTRQHAVLPVGRTGNAVAAMRGARGDEDGLGELSREPGVRQQL